MLCAHCTRSWRRDLIIAVEARHPWSAAEDTLATLGNITDTPGEWERRVEMMRRYRLDVLWALPGSRAHHNVLRAAVAAQSAGVPPGAPFVFGS